MNANLLAVALFAAASLECASTDSAAAPVDSATVQSEIPAYAPKVLRDGVPASAETVNRLFDQAARAAWAQINAHYYPATGLANAQPDWQYPTSWDIASTLAAYYSARGLGYISDAEYKTRASRLLATMKKARMYNDIAYGRNYDAATGELVGPDQKPHPTGTGFSAMDIGRLLTVLGIVARQDKDLAQAATDVASRINAGKIIQGGYLTGAELGKNGKPEAYQEGRIGYEQYAAEGFNLWNMKATGALSTRANRGRGTVLGIPIPTDKRGFDRLTSEPFIMKGLELGWSADTREMAWQTLSAQAARFEQTGKMTIASEDGIKLAPYYFYYYCVFCSGKPFVINIHSPGVNLDGPRWVSTKGAFGWLALLPNSYTWQATQAVRPALDPKTGWATGVFEDSGKTTDTYTLNTAALIMEAALYHKTGKPLIEQAR